MQKYKIILNHKQIGKNKKCIVRQNTIGKLILLNSTKTEHYAPVLGSDNFHFQSIILKDFFKIGDFLFILHRAC